MLTEIAAEFNRVLEAFGWLMYMVQMKLINRQLKKKYGASRIKRPELVSVILNCTKKADNSARSKEMERRTNLMLKQEWTTFTLELLCKEPGIKNPLVSENSEQGS